MRASMAATTALHCWVCCACPPTHRRGVPSMGVCQGMLLVCDHVCGCVAVAAAVCVVWVCAGKHIGGTPPPLDPSLLPMSLDHADLMCYGPWAKVRVCECECVCVGGGGSRF